MRQQGRLTEWNDDRGFGFIEPLHGGFRVFVHISEFPRDKRRPIAMDLVTYTVDRDDQNRPRAREVLFLAPTRPARIAQPAVAASRGLPLALVVSALLLAMAVIAAQFVGGGQVNETHPVLSPSTSTDEAVASAFREQRSGVQVAGEGVVTRVLPDDTDGGRHQRFIVRLASGHTLLVAHNIDVAPRLTSLEPGDSVAFFGVYEWNSEGGVIHWTHHDPSGQHTAGWLKHNGVAYQ